MNPKELWEILVPCVMNGKPVRTRHHKEWDKVVRSFAGGLTILMPAKGQWIEPGTSELHEERVIPVRIACTRKQIHRIVEFTIKHYQQKAVMAYLLSSGCNGELIIKYSEEDKAMLGTDLRATKNHLKAKALTAHAERVKQFMALAKNELPSNPTIPNAKIRELRVRLLLEEVLEFAEASGVRLKLEGEDDETSPLRFSEFTFETTNDVDLVEVADALGDISVVNVGSMLAYGIADTGLLIEVDNNNMAKFGPGGYKDPETGKWRKPPDHQPPRIADVLRAQGWCPATEGGEHEVNTVPVQSDGDKYTR
jgi:predicted HAD superfamily Cof-like phosphohydrolase